ncbi:hypothetical protein RB195_015681 [Necator americanus]|uniref:CC domain-containing protein n=1 Tax=Necator americanus TaxID=51031 RepID=A0ABR1E5P3_NECAM
MFHHAQVLLSLVTVIVAKDISRSKRQLQPYYICGGSSNGYISTAAGCGNFYNGCGSNCGGNNYGMIIPNSFYSPSTNCQSSCSNINCNQFNGQYINGQYVATVIGSSQYSPCGSSCCSGWNNWNSGLPMFGNSIVVSGTNNGFYDPYATNLNTGTNGFNPNYINTNPLTQVGPGPVILGTNVQRSPSAFTGTFSNGVLLCGGSEPAGGSCAGNGGQCPMGHLCMAGNVCCRCAVGASSGTCSSGSDSECPIGYSCSSTLSCCPSQLNRELVLTMCINGSCEDGYECGKGNLCYPTRL